MSKKKAITLPIASPETGRLPDIAGNPERDLQAFTRCKSVDFGIRLLEYYVPRNYGLLAYCRASRDVTYITENLNAILHGNN